MRAMPLMLLATVALAAAGGCSEKTVDSAADTGVAQDSGEDTGDDSGDDTGSPTDTGDDTGDDTGHDSGDDTGDDTAEPAAWAGTWSGVASFDVEEGGFSPSYGTCTMDVVVTLPSDVDGLEVIGEVSLECGLPNMSDGVLTFKGNAVTETEWTGDVHAMVSYGAAVSGFVGTISGDTMSVSVDPGLIQGGGELYWRWGATSFELTRAQ